MEYEPCEPCSKKVGSYQLCAPCYKNRTMIDALTQQIEEVKKFSQALGILRVEPTSANVLDLIKRWRR